MEKKTNTFAEALKKLNELYDEQGLGMVEKVYTHCMSDKLKEHVLKATNTKIGKAHPCAKTLNGKKCKPYIECFDVIPAADHVSVLNKDGKPIMIVSQPYGLDLDDFKEIVEYCEKNDLWVSINTNYTWHYPGNIIGLVYTKKNDHKVINK